VLLASIGGMSGMMRASASPSDALNDAWPLNAQVKR
jgi:hypothetical protein